MNDILRLVKRTVLDPAGTAAELAAPGAGNTAPLAVYFVYCAVYSLFLYLKPADFPSDLAEISREFSAWPYYRLLAARAAADLAFTACLCAFFSGTARFLAGGRLALKFLSGCALCAAGAAAAFAFKDSAAASFALLAAAAAAAFLSVRKDPAGTAAFFRFSLLASCAHLACLPLSFLAAGLRSEPLFLAAEFAGAVWLLVLTVKAAGALFGGAAARSVLALLFSSAASAAVFYLLKNLGAIPGGMFRFMLFM